MNRDADPVAALSLERYRFVHLIGGGGKTTLMLAAARALAWRGERVIATTSTRIRRREGEALGKAVICPDAAELATRAGEALARRNPIVVARAAEGDKLLGFPAEDLDGLAARGVADALLVEADGSAGRPLKAHAQWEPVIAPSADLVIAVVGAWCLGRPLDEETVHRAEIFAERVGCALTTPLTAQHVAAIVLHDQGYLARVPPGADVVVAVTTAAGDDGGLARALAAADEGRRLTRVVVLGPLAAGLGDGARPTAADPPA